jgi:hypothetical protein
MKNLFYLILLTITLSGCYGPEQDIYTDYCGAQVVFKGKNTDGYHYIRFRYEGKITENIRVVKYDWERLEVGDFVNCNEFPTLKEINEFLDFISK